MPDNSTDPVLKNSRREAVIIGLAWSSTTVYCCVTSYVLGYNRPGRRLGVEDIHPIFGVPTWVMWGIFVPWVVCAVFTFWFAGFFMTDDDLGADHSSELESDIREGGLHEHG